MRRFLLCAGVFGRPRCLGWLRQAIDIRRPDGVLFAGGVLDTGHHYGGWTKPDELGRNDAFFLERFLETLGGFGLFSAIIPGRWDLPFEDFLRIGLHAEVDYPGLHLVHATLVEEEDVAVSGVGGWLVDGSANALGTCSRTLAEYHLRPLWTAKQPRKILLLPAPPGGLVGGEEGSALIGELIDSFHPSLCVVAGPNGRRGTQRLGSSLVVNPGCLADGWAAWLDWNHEADRQIEFVNLRDLELANVSTDVGVCD
jgi:Metallophosphoesterase, calcineurin superfamily